ncbi:hypothetical protein PPGU19_026750 [Paraburkholderia sp. PGU19]|uniref:WbqC family protein n=1 Tax=Paraburkholderia sp. PGU19 TaxID=2735434 RepID=UPI0015DA3A21|nr:WbqC family protein [Paraburkholderia sp. PGU19]BCF98106.1 hypothetical protein PPGU19_026750 [Paraburkholderia sp. PGU19]
MPEVNQASRVIAIVQSCYIPWKGFFDLIASADEFILYDDMQYTRRDWRNRNLIKTPQGLTWLSVPVKVKGKYFQSIRETEIDGSAWQEKHWKSICQNYRRAPYFDEFSKVFESLYLEKEYTHLSDLNRTFIEKICTLLDISTALKWSWDYSLADGKTERLVNLCTQAGGTDYVSGPAARDYIDKNLFDQAGVNLHYFDYSNYPEYPQLWGKFEHGVSILDLLFSCGPGAADYMKFRTSRGHDNG